MKVEELSMYGKALEIPKEGLKKQKKIVRNILRNEFGVIGLIQIMLGVNKHSKRIMKEYPDAMHKAKNLGKKMDKQLTLLGALFLSIADKRGSKHSLKIMTSIVKNIAPISISALYELEELIKCEGDVFNNFNNKKK